MKKILIVLCILCLSSGAYATVKAPKWSDYYPSKYDAAIADDVYWSARESEFENDMTKCAFAKDEPELIYCYEYIKNKQANKDKELQIKKLKKELYDLQSTEAYWRRQNRELEDRIYDYKYNKK